MQSSDYSGPQPFLTNFYTGDGYSGTVFGRPALKQMEDAIRAGMVYAVLVKVCYCSYWFSLCVYPTGGVSNNVAPPVEYLLHLIQNSIQQTKQ